MTAIEIRDLIEIIRRRTLTRRVSNAIGVLNAIEALGLPFEQENQLATELSEALECWPK